MFFTIVPRLITLEDPRTFKSLITVTESPSFKTAPCYRERLILHSHPLYSCFWLINEKLDYLFQPFLLFLNPKRR